MLDPGQTYSAADGFIDALNQAAKPKIAGQKVELRALAAWHRELRELIV
jgi:hypothetical protein